jgi:hypothetical protein
MKENTMDIAYQTLTFLDGIYHAIYHALTFLTGNWGWIITGAAILVIGTYELLKKRHGRQTLQ